jgi:hypothetical protein
VKQIGDEINERIEARSEDGVVGRSELEASRPRIQVVNRTHFHPELQNELPSELMPWDDLEV